MKTILLFLLCILILGNIRAAADNNSDRSAYIDSMHAYIDSLESKGITSEKRGALHDLAEKDSRFALPAIRRPDIFQDHKILVIALDYPARDVQIEAATHLKNFGTVADIAPILKAYDRLNGEVIIGGAADFNNHNRFRDALVVALSAILKHPLVNASINNTDREAIINEARKHN